MWNTCSIGRRWKPCEGWSRPVLTGERGTLSNPCLVGWVSSCGGFLVGWQGTLFLVVTRTILVRRFACVRCPVPGPPRSESVAWLVSVLPAAGFPVGRCIGFAVVMAQVRRPVPFRTRKLRPGRGDGTALERVWESSTPPHSTLEDPPVESLMGFPEGPFFFVFPLGVPVGRHAPGTPFFVVLPARRPEPVAWAFRA